MLAYVVGRFTGGENGVADIPVLASMGVMGGGMFRDFAIVSTAFGVHIGELKKAGIAGVISIFAGVIVAFVVGALVAIAFGYRDAVAITTIAAGAVTYIVGPVTGAAIGASSRPHRPEHRRGRGEVDRRHGRHADGGEGNRTRQPAVRHDLCGGLMGTTSGVAGGLAATDPSLVPYGAMTATFYTGLGCLLGPSVLYLAVKALFG